MAQNQEKSGRYTDEEIHRAGTWLQSVFGARLCMEGDYEQGIPYLQSAATRGDAAAQYVMGGCYETGRGVAKDLSMARSWYERSAEQGYAEAQFRLAYLCSLVDEDDLAVTWWERAAAQGHEKAKKVLEIIREEEQGGQ